MPLRTYRGASTATLLARVQADLGPDAVIVRTTAVDGGLEIVAADPETAAEVSRLIGAPAAPARRAEPQPAAPAATSAQPAAVRTVIGLVGPTGAGKTTTIAKLAAHPRIFPGRRVGLLCLDTYRVGALEQLRTHAELSGIPMQPVHEPADLERALRRLKACDVILADCPGRSPRFQRDADAVGEILRAAGVQEIHLVLPAGLQPQLARRLIEHHASRGATHLLATKVDEMPDDWNLFELAAELGLPMRWLADGQRVPTDIRSAAPRFDAARAGQRGRRDRAQEGAA